MSRWTGRIDNLQKNFGFSPVSSALVTHPYELRLADGVKDECFHDSANIREQVILIFGSAYLCRKICDSGGEGLSGGDRLLLQHALWLINVFVLLA